MRRTPAAPAARAAKSRAWKFAACVCAWGFSYLFLSVPILGGDNQPTNQPNLRRPARSRQMPLALAGAPSRRDRPAAELGTRMPRCVLRPMPFAEPAALPPPPLTAPSTTCSSSSSALSTPSTPSTPSTHPSPAPSPPSPRPARRRPAAAAAARAAARSEI